MSGDQVPQMTDLDVLRQFVKAFDEYAKRHGDPRTPESGFLPDPRERRVPQMSLGRWYEDDAHRTLWNVWDFASGYLAGKAMLPEVIATMHEALGVNLEIQELRAAIAKGQNEIANDKLLPVPGSTGEAT